MVLWNNWLREGSSKAIKRMFWQAVFVIYCKLAPVLRRPVETTGEERTFIELMSAYDLETEVARIASHVRNRG